MTRADKGREPDRGQHKARGGERGGDIWCRFDRGGVLVGGPLVLTAAKARGILLVWQLVFMELFFLKAGFILS